MAEAASDAAEDLGTNLNDESAGEAGETAAMAGHSEEVDCWSKEKYGADCKGTFTLVWCGKPGCKNDAARRLGHWLGDCRPWYLLPRVQRAVANKTGT